MGNLSFIVPTKRLEDFNKEKIYELLLEKFPKLSIDMDEKFNMIQIHKNGNLVSDLYFHQDCYILDYDRDILILQEMIEEVKETKYPQLAERYLKYIEELKKLKEINPDLNNVIQSTYGIGREVDLKMDIDYLIKDYFEAYIFDEGIHPEFQTPDYKRPEKRRIKKFINFFKK